MVLVKQLVWKKDFVVHTTFICLEYLYCRAQPRHIGVKLFLKSNMKFTSWRFQINFLAKRVLFKSWFHLCSYSKKTRLKSRWTEVFQYHWPCNEWQKKFNLNYFLISALRLPDNRLTTAWQLPGTKMRITCGIGVAEIRVNYWWQPKKIHLWGCTVDAQPKNETNVKLNSTTTSETLWPLQCATLLG